MMRQGKRKMEIGRISLLCIVFLLANLTASANATKAQINVTSKQIGLAADFNRDGVIEFSQSLTKNNVRTDLNTNDKPFVFWVNDDNDDPDSETKGVDVFNAGSTQDSDSLHIEGSRDLIDFFAVALDMHNYLTTEKDWDKKTYWLQQGDSAVNVVFTEMSRGTIAGQGNTTDYLKKINMSNVTDLFGSWQTQGKLNNVFVERVIKAGKKIPKEFIELIRDDKNKGVILIEGDEESSEPLRLLVQDENRNTILDAELPIRIYKVEKLFRQVSLREDGRDEDSTKWGVNRVGVSGPDIADLLTDLSTQSANIQSIFPSEINMNNHVIFIHGFNVTFEQAREAQSEVYKRLYHSGSKALLTGVHWNGDAGLINPVNYWYDVENAFYTADDFSVLINGINGTGVKKTIIAHSLGNMLVGLAIQDFSLSFNNYFMLNPAVATEAYQSVTNAKEMRHPDWDEYYFGDNYQADVEAENYDGVRSDGKNGRLLWSTEWNKFFTDDRKTLTWRNRLSTVGGSTKVVQYYSSGEEVLRAATSGAPDPFDAFPELPFISNTVIGNNAWNIQEKSKGTGNAFAVLAGNSSAGWGFNATCEIPDTLPVVIKICSELNHDEARLFFNSPEVKLIAQPFFERFDEVGLMELSFNQDALDNSYPHVMGFEIPALSHAAGGTASSIFELKGNAFDMNNERFDDWPQERGGVAEKKWRHSDYKDVSYRYVYPLYDDIVTRGSLQ